MRANGLISQQKSLHVRFQIIRFLSHLPFNHWCLQNIIFDHLALCIYFSTSNQWLDPHIHRSLRSTYFLSILRYFAFLSIQFAFGTILRLPQYFCSSSPPQFLLMHFQDLSMLLLFFSIQFHFVPFSRLPRCFCFSFRLSPIPFDSTSQTSSLLLMSSSRDSLSQTLLISLIRRYQCPFQSQSIYLKCSSFSSQQRSMPHLPDSSFTEPTRSRRCCPIPPSCLLVEDGLEARRTRSLRRRHTAFGS